MKKLLLLIAISAIPGFLLSHAQAQIGDFGAIGEVKFSKELSRVVEISVGQELRFNQFATSLSRSATSLESDITIIDKVLRANFEYKLLFNRENGIFETRHRTSAGLLIEIDGGVGEANAARLFDAGVHVLVAGSAVFNSENPEAVIRQMLE